VRELVTLDTAEAQIHQQQWRQIDGIISPVEQEDPSLAKQSTMPATAVVVKILENGAGPRGEMSTGHKPSPRSDNKTPPNDTAKPN
jgi:hypothetical protein